VFFGYTATCAGGRIYSVAPIHSQEQPLVCGIALHTMNVGQPYRLRMLREALQHIVSHPEKEKVWFTRPSAIYDHCAALPASKFPPA